MTARRDLLPGRPVAGAPAAGLPAGIIGGVAWGSAAPDAGAWAPPRAGFRSGGSQ